MWKLISAFLLVLAATLALPRVSSGATAPLESGEWTNCGEATRSLLFLDLYTVEVYLPDCSLFKRGVPQALEGTPVHFLVNVHWDRDRPDDLPDVWESQLMPVCNSDQERKLITIYERARKGDRVDIRYIPGEGTRISLNDEVVIEEASYDMLHAFFELWYSESPVADDLIADAEDI